MTNLGYGYTLIAGKNNSKSLNSKLILDLLDCLDSKNDLIDISYKLNTSIDHLFEIIQMLKQNKLISYVIK